MAGLIYLAIIVPIRPRNLLGRCAPFLIYAAILVSLSRTALVIASVMLIFTVVRGKRGTRAVKSFVLIVISMTAGYLLVTNYSPLRARFFDAGDSALNFGGISINTSGRSSLWETIIASANKAPLFGHGPGSASEIISSAYGYISHPHSDYLRLYHDYGYVGLGLFCVGYLALMIHALRNAIRTDEPIHWTALLGLAAVAIAAATDNAIVYPYVMIPLGIIVGCSISLSDLKVTFIEPKKSSDLLSFRRSGSTLPRISRQKHNLQKKFNF